MPSSMSAAPDAQAPRAYRSVIAALLKATGRGCSRRLPSFAHHALRAAAASSRSDVVEHFPATRPIWPAAQPFSRAFETRSWKPIGFSASRGAVPWALPLDAHVLLGARPSSVPLEDEGCRHGVDVSPWWSCRFRKELRKR